MGRAGRAGLRSIAARRLCVRVCPERSFPPAIDGEPVGPAQQLRPMPEPRGEGCAMLGGGGADYEDGVPLMIEHARRRKGEHHDAPPFSVDRPRRARCQAATVGKPSALAVAWMARSSAQVRRSLRSAVARSLALSFGRPGLRGFIRPPFLRNQHPPMEKPVARCSTHHAGRTRTRLARRSTRQSMHCNSLLAPFRGNGCAIIARIDAQAATVAAPLGTAR